MKMRKLFAGLAAAATLLSGMALGVASAQADDAPATPLLQVNHAQEGHTYTPYRFATFENPRNGSVEVTTVDAWKEAVTTAADVADKGNSGIPAEYEDNPAAYVATFTADQLRVFAKTLAGITPPAGPDGTGLIVTKDQANTSQAVNVAGEGWYLVKDTFTKAGETTETSGTPAVVATTVSGLSNLKIVPDAETGQGNITAEGQFNAKNANPTDEPLKFARMNNVDVNGKSVKVGDTVDFTVAADVPHAAAGWDVYPFTITDTASKGLQIAATSDFKVQFGDHTTVDSSLYTITQESNAQSGITTTIHFDDATTLAGRTIVVMYQGTVTKDALNGLNGSVDNKATITTKHGTSGEGKTILKTYGFKFKKIGKEGNETKPLAGAEFVVKNAKGEFLKQAEDGAWSFVPNQADAKKFTTKIDGTEIDGLVEVAGLAAGTYTVVETQAPTGYASNFRVTFKVEITDKGIVTFEPDALHQVQPEGNTTANATATVLNVKNITQLPLTGAAGTVLFTVVALLLGGAGVAVAVKSRRRMY